ncbi:somatostatin isoform 1-T1 [Sylvia borin]
MEPRVPQAQPGTSTPRPEHQFVIASRGCRAGQEPGNSPGMFPLPRSCPLEGSGDGPVPERPTGAGEAKRNPRGTSAPPTSCRSRRQSPLRGPFAAPRLLELRGRSRLQGEGLWQSGRSSGRTVIWGRGLRAAGGEGSSGGTMEAWRAPGRAEHPRSRSPPSQRPTPGGAGRGGRPRLDVRRRVYKGGGRRGDPQRRSRAAAEPPAPPAAACRARPAGEMLSCRLQCALALLSIALAVGTVSAAPSDPRLRQFLQKSLAAAAGKQELAKYFLAELLSEPSQTENEALESEDLSRGAEQDEVRLELERSANSNPALAPRERKAGCKNFFWKTFTSC